ncbi:hypothetical protein AB0F43_30090 [Kribbella sp. NPDC023972]|uniref:hypothetical protein n=1 Tax=Kribbella sp. NPDC023972 TaxID=3154795 RepID=UPI0033DA2344
MTDIRTTTRTHPARPLTGDGPLPGRLLRSMGYDARLVVFGVRTMADAVTGENRTEPWRREQLARSVEPERVGAERVERAGGRSGLSVGAERAGGRSGRSVEPERGEGAGVGPGPLFGFGLVSSVLGLVSWFLLGLLGLAVVRGVFYGFVERGPVGPGTWGGPTLAGAWVAHAVISVPIVVGLLCAMGGIRMLHGRLVRRLYGLGGRWVLPATIGVCATGMLLMWSWIQQL